MLGWKPGVASFYLEYVFYSQKFVVKSVVEQQKFVVKSVVEQQKFVVIFVVVGYTMTISL